MITDTLKTWTGEIKDLLTNPRALGMLAVLYAVLLATLYWFISIREATVSQVAITFVLLVLIPIEFFVLQAAILQRARTQKFNWRQIGRDAIKLAVVTIPIILLGFLVAYLLNKWQAHYPAPEPLLTAPGARTPPATQPIHWPSVLFATARLLLLGVALPLASIHLWIEVAAQDTRSSFGGGVKSVLRRVGNALAGAFAFDSVLTFALGLIIFVLATYAILFLGHPPKGNKTDFAVFVTRLLFAFLFTLIGWVVTLTTLARLEPTPAAPVNAIPDAPLEAPA
jgi:hypothetical protein